MNTKQSIDDACDSLDAVIFTGDALTDPDNRNTLREWMQRWSSELNSYDGGTAAIEQLNNLGFFFAWMSAPNPLLGGIKPLQMMQMGRGDKLANFITDAMEDFNATSEIQGK